MKINKLYSALSLLVLLSMVLTACAPAAATATEAPAATTEQPAATEAPTAAPTEIPTAAPTTRHGGWLDEIEYSVVDSASAISRLQAGAIDFYSFTLASDSYPAIKSAGLPTTKSVGGYYGISLNPAVFTDKNVLNPFSDRKIREAMNWLIDRNYVNQEIYAGGSLPKVFTNTTQFTQYTNLFSTARALESKYAYNLYKTKELIKSEKPRLG